MSDGGDDKLRSGRLGRLAQLGSMAARLAGDAAKSAGSLTLSAGAVEAKRRLHERASKTLLRHLSEMKGLPMKVGQLLSYIEELVPAEHRDTYRQTLSELQTRSRPMLWEHMKAQLEEDLGRPLEACFRSFDTEPIAAASIGQVYRATTLGGHEVVVKIQYPGIDQAIDSDLKNLDTLVKTLSRALPKVDIEQSLRDVAARLREECDYRLELEQQQHFAAAWSEDPLVVVPEAFPELCGARVLTSTFIPGQTWDVMMRQSDALERERYGHTIFRFVFRSMYVFGRFNGDPHPGNYLFLGDGKVAFIDYGCVQRYDRESLRRFSHARRLAAQGVRGAPFRQAAVEAYGLPAEVDEQLWSAFEDYLYLSFEPLLAEQPYQYNRAYTDRLATATTQMRRLVTRKIFSAGIFDTKRPGAVFLHRINFGLNAVLAQLGARGHWPREIDAIQREAGLL